jgi:hypothetical protein
MMAVVVVIVIAVMVALVLMVTPWGMAIAIVVAAFVAPVRRKDHVDHNFCPRTHPIAFSVPCTESQPVRGLKARAISIAALVAAVRMFIVVAAIVKRGAAAVIRVAAIISILIPKLVGSPRDIVVAVCVAMFGECRRLHEQSRCSYQQQKFQAMDHGAPWFIR